MNKDVISTPNAPAAVGPYSQGIRVGDIFFLSGQIPLDPATGKLVEGDICAQAEQCCKNVVALLESQGLTTANVQGAVKTANGDVAVKAAASGYSGKDVTVYVAFSADGTVSGISIDGSTQTTGIGSKVSGDSFASGFIGWNGGEVSSGSPVDSIAGATYSSNGAFNAINAAIDCYNNEIKGVQ